MKQLSLFVALLISFISYGHQPDLSTTVLSKTTDGKYVIQITSSLSAFEGEIEYLYSKDSYKSADAFKNLVIDHFNKNVLFIVNKKDTLQFKQPLVLLGHETKMIVEVLNIPKDIQHIYYTNTMFKDMPHNQMATIMITDGFPKEQYVLDNDNKQTIVLEKQDGKWISIIDKDYKAMIGSLLDSKNVLYIGFLLFVGLFSVFYIRKSNKETVKNTVTN